jgi:hypothetical protein
MLKGTTVIFNEEYIDEVVRHRDIAKRKYEQEHMPNNKERLQKEYEAWERKLEWSLNFQDSVDFVQNMEVPKITVCKTIGGLEIPAKHLQAV